MDIWPELTAMHGRSWAA